MKYSNVVYTGSGDRGGGYTVMPGPSFDQYLVVKDQDILIEQSLTLIKHAAMLISFFKLHNL